MKEPSDTSYNIRAILPTDFNDEDFKPGQIYQYKSRVGEEASTLTILKVEKYDPINIVIHIYINGLKMKNPHGTANLLAEIVHLPLSKDAVLKSVTKLLSSGNEIPNYKDGYDIWRKAFDNDKAGVYAATVAEVIECIQATINSGKPEVDEQEK